MAWLARWDQSPGPNVKDEETRTKGGKKRQRCAEKTERLVERRRDVRSKDGGMKAAPKLDCRS